MSIFTYNEVVEDGIDSVKFGMVPFPGLFGSHLNVILDALCKEYESKHFDCTNYFVHVAGIHQ